MRPVGLMRRLARSTCSVRPIPPAWSDSLPIGLPVKADSLMLWRWPRRSCRLSRRMWASWSGWGNSTLAPVRGSRPRGSLPGCWNSLPSSRWPGWRWPRGRCRRGTARGPGRRPYGPVRRFRVRSGIWSQPRSAKCLAKGMSRRKTMPQPWQRPLTIRGWRGNGRNSSSAGANRSRPKRSWNA